MRTQRGGQNGLFPWPKELVYSGPQLPGQTEGQDKSGVILVVLNGVDSLAGDPAPLGQLLLGDAPLLPQGPDDVLHVRHHTSAGNTAD